MTDTSRFVRPNLRYCMEQNYSREGARVPGEREEEAIARFAEDADRFCSLFCCRSPDTFLRNTCSHWDVWRSERLSLPLLVVDGGRDQAAICSMRSYYADYAAEEARRRLRGRLQLHVVLLGLAGIRRLIDALGLDRVVFVNHWLLSSNPTPPLDLATLEQLTADLRKRYPDRALVIRSLNPLTGRGLLQTCSAEGFRLVRSRRVWIFDPTHCDCRKNRDILRDLRKLHESGCDRNGMQATPDDVPLLASQYRRLYLAKYSRYNPDFTEEFFHATLVGNVLEYRTLRSTNGLDGFVAWYDGGEEMAGELVGYDLSKPQKLGLFRQCMAAQFEASLRTGRRLNLGSGNSRFKRFRGAQPVLEYDAVYCRHLPVGVRTAWRTLTALLLLWERITHGRYE